MVVLASISGNLAVVIQRRYADPPDTHPHHAGQAPSEMQHTTGTNTPGGTEYALQVRFNDLKTFCSFLLGENASYRGVDGFFSGFLFFFCLRNDRIRKSRYALVCEHAIRRFYFLLRWS